MKRVHILISGRVQGVGFRYFIKSNANRLGIFGWVRNLDIGNVEVLAEGEETNIEKFIGVCKKGHLFSRVNNIIVENKKLTNKFKSFEIVY